MRSSEIVKSFLASVEDKRLDEAFDLLSEDLVVRGPAPVPLGKKEYTGVHSAWAKACPDWRFNCSKLDERGDKVVATIRITATHSGELNMPMPGLPQRIAGTGRKAALPEEHPEFTVRDGKIVALEFVAPPGGGVPGLLAQFGIAPAQAHAAAG